MWETDFLLSFGILMSVLNLGEKHTPVLKNKISDS